MTGWRARAAARLADLSQVSEPGPGVTRLPFSPEHRRAVDFLTSDMAAASLPVTVEVLAFADKEGGRLPTARIRST